jgi:peptide/nickel transport system substrate-binding protein
MHLGYDPGAVATPLRVSPRKGWYHNLKDVIPSGDFEVTFQLGRPQPAMLALLASGYSAIYPCHVSPADMRTKPIGTGPFKFVEYKRNELIVLTRNTDYWRANRPYLDGVEYTIVPNRSTSILGFVTGRFDMTFPNEVVVPLLKDVRAQAPTATCLLETNNCAVNIIINRDRAPFDNPEVRRALAFAIDRKGFSDILTEGQGVIGDAMQPAPEGSWGMPAEMLKDLPG